MREGSQRKREAPARLLKLAALAARPAALTCQAALEVEPTLNPNYGVDHCPKCHYFMTIETPNSAKVPDDWTRPDRKRCRIIEFSEIQRQNQSRRRPSEV